jgi:hypothetical protein
MIIRFALWHNANPPVAFRPTTRGPKLARLAYAIQFGVLPAANKETHRGDEKKDSATGYVKFRTEHEPEADGNSNDLEAEPSSFRLQQSSGRPLSDLVGTNHASTATFNQKPLNEVLVVIDTIGIVA